MHSELSFLRGKDIFVGDILIKQYTLEELDEMGIERCQQLLLITILDVKELFQEGALSKEVLGQIELYDIVCALPNLNEWFLELLNLYVYGKWEYSEEFAEFLSYSEESVLTINKKNFEDILKTIQKAYCIVKAKSEYDKETATSDEVAKMLEEFEQIKRNQNKHKAKVTLDSIIESVAAKHSSYNFFNIWGLTLYQLMKTYYRMEHIENYENVMRSIYAGVMSSKDIKIEEIHWANKTPE